MIGGKHSQIGDNLRINNSIGILLTETWLEARVEDAKIFIDNFSIFRSDRIGRERGGVAAYFRSDLGCMCAHKFCNGVVQTILIKYKKLDTLFGVNYRPPNTTSDLWNEAMLDLDNAIMLAQAHGDYNNIVIGGDFNFHNLKWEDGLFQLSIGNSGQEETLISFMNNTFMANQVNIPTRENIILDLLITNAPE